MNAQQYNNLLETLSDVANELYGQETSCDFSEDAPEYEIDENYSQLWEDR